jgi:hypothetical protein
LAITVNIKNILWRTHVRPLYEEGN